METVISFVVRNLRAAGPRRWAAIAATISEGMPQGDAVGEALLRKIAYGDRTNPGTLTIEPLRAYFHAVERGEVSLPAPLEPSSAA